MKSSLLTALLAERVLGWKVSADRFLLGDRQWKPRHYFQPMERATDALKLLNAAEPERYSISAEKGFAVTVEVRINGLVGQASASSQARSITLAIARALGIEVEL